MATVDVTIRGAGILGLSAAWTCLNRGARVQVIDPNGVGSGASGGPVGALAPHTPEAWNDKKAIQLDSLLMAEAFWAAVEAASGQSAGYGRTGRLQPVADERALQLARRREESAREVWGAAAAWRVVPAEGRAWAPGSPTGWLIEDTLSARIAPARACAALAGAIRVRGGDIAPEGPDMGVVIHATGWEGLRELSRALGREVGSGVKGQAVLLRHAAPGDAPQIFADGLHIVPHEDGTVALGSTTERDWDDPRSTDARADDLIERAVAVLPVLHGATVVRRWAGVRPRAVSRAPVLAPWPGRPGHVVLNGGFKIGFGMAPKLAELAAGLALEGEAAIPGAFAL